MTREETKMIKCIAILLMLAHHMFVFQPRLPNSFMYDIWFSYNGQSFAQIIGSFGKICVSIFMFLGGYGMYVRHSKGTYHVQSAILKLYQNYWKIFIIYIPIAFLFFGSQPIWCEDATLCTVYTDFNFFDLITNFVGWRCTYNQEWWFLFSYLIAVLWGSLFIAFNKKTSCFWIEFAEVIVITFLIQIVFPNLSILPLFSGINDNLLYAILITPFNSFCCSFLMGCVFAKYACIEKMRNIFSGYRIFIRICMVSLLMVLLVYLRVFVFTMELDIFFVPCFIVICVELFAMLPQMILKVLHMIGDHSANMWLIHSFYCYYFYTVVRIVFCTSNALADYLILVFLTLFSSIIINKFYETLLPLKRILKKDNG